MEFSKLDLSVDIKPLQAALETTELWDRYPYRRIGPHKEMVDIWVRFNNIQPFLRSGDFSKICEEHDSIWYPSAITELVKPIAFKIMGHVKGERLGGILITKLQPFGTITPHSDTGWHSEYYQKYYVCIRDRGSVFHFTDGEIKPSEGEIYWFNNSKQHGVKNGDGERISMIICVKTDEVTL